MLPQVEEEKKRMNFMYRRCDRFLRFKWNKRFLSTSSPFGSRVNDEIDLITGLTLDQQQLRSSVREFIEKELPLSVSLKIDKLPASELWPDFSKLWRKLGSMGLLGPTVDTKYGGLALGYLDHIIIMEELSRIDAGIALSYGAHSNLCVNQIYLNGSDEQKAKYLPKLIDGSFIGSLAMSESTSGSDVTSMKLKAEKHGDYYILNGSKYWITNSSLADVIFVYARTSERGITAFIVEKGTPGFSVGLKIDKLGMRSSPTAEIIFEDCKIPASAMVGKEHQGVYVLMSGLDFERLVLSGGPIGIAQRVVEETFNYTHERHQFDQPVASFQLVQGKLADMLTRLNACRSYLYSTARAIDQAVASGHVKVSGRTTAFTKHCAGCLMMSAEMATSLALDGIQLHGGNGYTNEYIVSKCLRDAKLYEIGAGTSEIRRWLIGREINKVYSS